MAILNFLLEIFTNGALVVPTISWLIAQVLKSLIDAAVNKTFRISRLFGDGGMPSGHSATVVSLATVVGCRCGFGGTEFAVAAILAIVVMHDALGVRRETGKQAVAIMKMVEVISEYVSEKDEELKFEKLKVLVGHTPLQVFCGALLGIAVAVIYMFVFPG